MNNQELLTQANNEAIAKQECKIAALELELEYNKERLKVLTDRKSCIHPDIAQGGYIYTTLICEACGAEWTGE